MKMPEPIGWGNHGQIDNINLGYAYIYPAEGAGAHRPLYDKQALIDLLEEAAVEAEDADNIVDGKGYYQQGGDANATAGKIAAAIRSMKEKL